MGISFQAQLYVDALEKLVVDLKRKNRVDLCMSYARAQPWITEVLIGAERIEQLAELVELVRCVAVCRAVTVCCDGML